ncbi:MAG: methyltransferase domain-containing protein [Nitrososphaerota archaeon]|nr:methyltransferase domain-containing protein [Candidatus Bathyarchaeota archaeon]MDW8061587.1 methyltransferase domain-containing protein [Nitrososphaerota archaeon]
MLVDGLDRFKYRFRWLRIPVFTVECLQRALKEYRITLDLGLSRVACRVSEKCLYVNELCIDVSSIGNLRDNRAIYMLENGVFKPIAFWGGEHFYKLISVKYDAAPTLEIDGIHMHRVSGISPWNDAKLKVYHLMLRKGMNVLDIGTGLGYTAIWCRRMGAIVYTVEKDQWVLKIASFNPWSRFLDDPNINIILSDAYDLVGMLPDLSFHRILHDPPRFSLAGELYSLEFYKKLYRLLKPGGLLLHYTGKPGMIQGRRLVGGVAKRLREAGFENIEWIDKVQGFRCLKS